MIVIDEVLTPDSLRFWPADDYLPGQRQPSIDKQFVRDWLATTSWDKEQLAAPHRASARSTSRHSSGLLARRSRGNRDGPSSTRFAGEMDLETVLTD